MKDCDYYIGTLRKGAIHIIMHISSILPILKTFKGFFINIYIPVFVAFGPLIQTQ